MERMRERMVDAFQRLDADGDAAVTSEEFARPGDRRFMWMDRNGDNQVTMDEMRQMRGGRHGRGGRGERARRGRHGLGGGQNN